MIDVLKAYSDLPSIVLQRGGKDNNLVLFRQLFDEVKTVRAIGSVKFVVIHSTVQQSLIEINHQRVLLSGRLEQVWGRTRGKERYRINIYIHLLL